MDTILAWRFGPEGWSRTEVPEALIEAQVLTVVGDEFGANIEILYRPREQDDAFWVATDAGGASLVLVDKDDLPSRLRLLNELQGLMALIQAQTATHTSSTLRRMFIHKHRHEPDIPCRLCE